MRAKNEDTKIRIYEYINEYIKNNRVQRRIKDKRIIRRFGNVCAGVFHIRP